MSDKPLITANQVTMLRIVLLPIPIVLLYGGSASILVGMVLLVLLGITDYIDGMLARKYGSTAFGRFLDPLADKLMVAAMFLPLVHRGFIPGWIVALMLAREFLVTDLRTVYSHIEHDMPTSEAAKIKTNMQMMGGSLILFLVALADTVVPLVALAIVCGGLWLAGGVVKVLGRKIHRFLWTAMSLWLLALVVVLIFGNMGSVNVIALIIVVFTVYTGWQYLSGGWHRLRAFMASNLLAAAALILSGIVLPLSLVLTFTVEPPLVALLYFVVLFELTVGGIENFLSIMHSGLRWPERFLKLALVCASLLMLLIYGAEGLTPLARYTLVLVAFAISFYYFIWYAWSYRDRLMAGSGTTQAGK